MFISPLPHIPHTTPPLSFGKPGCRLADVLPSCPTPCPRGTRPWLCCEVPRCAGYLQDGRAGGAAAGVWDPEWCLQSSPCSPPGPSIYVLPRRLRDETLVGREGGGGEISEAQKVAGQGQQDAYLASGVSLVRLTTD